MLCYAMLCYAMLCYAMLCYAMLCYAMLCYAMLCYAMLCYAMLCYAILYYTILYYTILYYNILCYSMVGQGISSGSNQEPWLHLADGTSHTNRAGTTKSTSQHFEDLRFGRPPYERTWDGGDQQNRDQTCEIPYFQGQGVAARRLRPGRPKCCQLSVTDPDSLEACTPASPSSRQGFCPSPSAGWTSLRLGLRKGGLQFVWVMAFFRIFQELQLTF